MSTSDPKAFIQGSAVEGLYVRALKPTGAFEEELRQVGVDVKRLEATYPLPVWYAAMRVALRHVAPHLPEEQGYRLLGDRFIAGFFDTLVGKLVAVGVPLLGPDKTLERLARTWSAAQPTLRAETRKVGDGLWQVTLQQAGVLPDFCSGILEAGLSRANVKPQATVLERSYDHCVIQVRW
ncbi:DUF2378 family protein [Aggregicoccus sp. 17bor-14]|uniref:DUF2378 family protein n=1 Tax=Myxococcaceae TaxID=31 RepID=UPI00129C5130|nr:MULTISPECIES: DUF2378 family protein [Myxococcaceae]MBF5045212.1 DUF2378 family protein [Simulacricoccus sp. 17bor-14]MRI90953.1 DUF2378 family protein [Aggregicoccus sp. 17bor-14]